MVKISTLQYKLNVYNEINLTELCEYFNAHLKTSTANGQGFVACLRYITDQSVLFFLYFFAL
jgi:hypothetical protein